MTTRQRPEKDRIEELLVRMRACRDKMQHMAKSGEADYDDGLADYDDGRLSELEYWIRQVEEMEQR